MIRQHIILKNDIGYLADHPHLKAHIVAQMHLVGDVRIEEVATHYGISLADVYATIAYYYDNQEKIVTRHRKLVEQTQQLGGANFRELHVSDDNE